MKMDDYERIDELCMIVNEGDTVKVTDPCYAKNVWCTLEENIPKGRYDILIKGDGKTVRGVAMVNKTCSYLKAFESEYLGDIGVDSGMAGFFVNKPNFEGDGWEKFLNEYVFSEPTEYHSCPWGVFTTSGDGDGTYEVYTLHYGGRIVGLAIDFEEDFDEEDY